jgi:hypothetical protein
MTEAVDKEIRDIDYISKDFNGYKTDLIDFLKKYFPDTWQDFSQVSGGMALLEMVAYVGDSLSFLMDRQINEGFIDRAIEPSNVYSLAQNMGYKPKFSTPATTTLSLSATFFDSTSSDSMFKVLKETVFSSDNFINYELIEDVDFSNQTNRTTIRNIAESKTTYVKNAVIIAGRTKTFEYSVLAPQPFLTIKLPDVDISEIYSVIDGDGNEWVEVDSLAQQSVFYGEENTDSLTNQDVGFILKQKKVSRKYVTQKSAEGSISLVFGNGVSTQEDSEIIPNPENFVLPINLRGSVSAFTPKAINSADFLNTTTLGVAPKNTTLKIRYRVGGGSNTNAPVGSITSISNKNIEFLDSNFESSNPSVSNFVVGSLQINNRIDASGGSDAESLADIRHNAINSMNSQYRAVTLNDYQSRALSLPSVYGNIFRAKARKNPFDNNGVQLYIVGLDENNNIKNLNNVVKNNLERYLNEFKSFSDNILINNGIIANIQINFSITKNSTYSNNEVLLEAFNILKGIFFYKNIKFGDSFVISDIMSTLQASPKILSVGNLNITNIIGSVGGSVYSNSVIDIRQNNGVITLPENVVWEVKYPNKDIIGTVV